MWWLGWDEVGGVHMVTYTGVVSLVVTVHVGVFSFVL